MLLREQLYSLIWCCWQEQDRRAEAEDAAAEAQRQQLAGLQPTQPLASHVPALGCRLQARRSKQLRSSSAWSKKPNNGRRLKLRDALVLISHYLSWQAHKKKKADERAMLKRKRANLKELQAKEPENLEATCFH